MKKIIFIIILVALSFSKAIAANPFLNFSDITSGPKTGNTDGFGSGAIVTVWGNNLGSTQGTSKVFVGEIEAPTVYYWKDADGQLPGGPADLSTYHKMQEIAFAVPAGAVDGANTIKVMVGGVNSNTIPFTVRSGNIYFVKSTGNDSSGTGAWTAPWQTLHNVVRGDNGKISAGDIVYTCGITVSNSVVKIGEYARLTGTEDNPFSVLAYPNTTNSLSGGSSSQNYMLLYNYGGSNSYWNYSKFSFETVERVLGLQKGMRVIGNNVTGPNLIGESMTGWVGGNCTGAADPTWCGGARIYGNEVHHYGNAATVNSLVHLYYLSNRSGASIPGYEIAWNYHHDNPVYQGIHVYDQALCGGWSSPIKIHNNVVKNQSGSSININTSCTESNDFEVHDNLLIWDGEFGEIVTPACGSTCSPACVQACIYAGSAFRVETLGNIKIYNNTVHGYRTSMVLGNGTIDYKNNLVVDISNTAYSIATAPESQAGNLFFSEANASLTVPSWASGAINSDPLFAGSGDFSLTSSSPAIAAGVDTTSLSITDLIGSARDVPVSIGAFEYIDVTQTSIQPTSFRVPGGVPYGIVQ